MEQTQLWLVVNTDDPTAENTAISQYLGTLEMICTDIANRFNADAEDLLSEGYVQLVTAFRDLVGECRGLIDDEQHDAANAMIAGMTEKLTHTLKLKLTQYASSRAKNITTESSDALVDTAGEPAAEDNIQHTNVPSHLINPFTRIANMCHEIGGSCFPPEDCRMNIIQEIARLYQLSTADAGALLKSYETYVEEILADHFNSQH